ncbi:MAG: VCBS repeat-containing protein [Pyrinomonadaceae bacterium]|nr:VCBS repeat-containing protein [Pyrinomonadaceae bacterium]MBP6212563.1 VCBS repeat-containing protein [Pyrinomonadaceae bacterium]
MLILALIFAWSGMFASGSGQAEIGLRVEQVSQTKWDVRTGVAYVRVPGTNLGAVSFAVLDDRRIAYLSNSTNEVIVVDTTSGEAMARFDVDPSPRDLAYSDGSFFVLLEDSVARYDEDGKRVGTFAFSRSYRGVERLARFGDATYLLLPSGNSVKIESGGRAVTAVETVGWMTESGRRVEIRLGGNGAYTVRVFETDGSSRERQFVVDKKVAGVFAVGTTDNRLVLDVQTFRSEAPVSVERSLVVIELEADGIGPIVAKTPLPDCYFVYSNRDLDLRESGELYNMVTSPEGAFVFALTETTDVANRDFPLQIAQAGYHYNDHLLNVDSDANTALADAPSDLAPITRQQIISNAVPYTTQTWTASGTNIWAGVSCGGKTIQTPAWVQVGTNTSMPYCWGGWTTVSAIQGYLDAGRSAGDNNTVTAFGAEPACAVGLDCSGFVSRAWALSAKQSTSSLPNISTSRPLSTVEPGDILNIAGDHTRLVETNYGNGNYRVIESSGADWKTSYRTYTAAQLASYDPRYYNDLSVTAPGSFTLTLTPECSGTSSRVRLNWTASAGATSYDVYRNGSLYFSGITGTQFINSGNITVGTTYSYFVRARNSIGTADTDTHAAVAPNCSPLPAAPRAFDFDGDNKSDLSIFRPGPGEWWYLKSSNGTNSAVQFGTSTDIITPADLTGDGKTDMAFFRPATGFWYVLRSEDLSFYAFPFGTAGDVPVPSDYDADGKADAAVFRPSSSTWYINNSGGGTTIMAFGAAGDLPVAADYDGDGKADVAVFRPGLGEWWINRSTAGLIAYGFGQNGDRTVAADHTGDGKADIAFWRPATGEWFVLRSENSTFYAFPFGFVGDVPAPGDYDGDGKTDAAVFRPSNSTWYANRSTAGVLIQQFGQTGDLAVPGSFVR